MTAEPSERKPTLCGRFLYCMVMTSCRKAPPEFRFASSTLRNSVPPGAAHEAAAGHAPAEPSDNLQQWLLLDFYPHLVMVSYLSLHASCDYGTFAFLADFKWNIMKP